MRLAGTVSIFAERRGKIVEFSVTWWGLAFLAVVFLAATTATTWLATSGVPTVQSRLRGLGDPMVSADTAASLAEAVRAAGGQAHEVEDILARVSAAVGDAVPEGGLLFHGNPADAFELSPSATPADQLQDLSEVLGYGSDTLQTVAGLTSVLNDRVLRHVPNAWPVGRGAGKISFEFGPAIHPFTQSWYMHKGVDIASPPGVPVVAMADGEVTEVRRDTNNYGLQVVVSYKHGFRSRYAHLSRSDVSAGDAVSKGERIGAVGSSGLTTGPTLHLELFLGEEVLDPAPFLAMSTALSQRRRER